MFIDKSLEKTTERLNDIAIEATTKIDNVTNRANSKFNSMAKDIKSASVQVSALSAMGMVAFSLISLVAISALLMASRKN